MVYQVFKPTQYLSEYIRAFWLLETDTKDGAPDYRLFADSCPNLVFQYKKPSVGVTGNFDGFIAGPKDGFIDMRMEGTMGLFGVYLYPYVIPSIFNIPSAELVNHAEEISNLLGREGKEFEEKVITAPGSQQRMQLISDFITGKLAKNSSPEMGIVHSVSTIIQTGGSVPVDTISKQCFLSHRQFERKFQSAVGLAPKLFSRINRFSALLSLYRNKTPKNLAELSYVAGYSDQSHFIRDFREFSGLTPGIYFKQLDETADNFVRLK